MHHNIFNKQFGVKVPDSPVDRQEAFDERLWLIFGDQLTAQRIRSVKAEQQSAERSYNRRDWMLGIPAWFHIQMNLLRTIALTHFEKSGGQSTRHTIKSDGVFWKRTLYTKETVVYHLMEPLVIQGFNARVISLFYAAMTRHNLLSDAVDTAGIDQVDVQIEKMTALEFNDLVEDIRTSAFTLEAWEGKDQNDVEFTNMCRLLQEIETFLTVRHVIKAGDIGHLRRLVDPLIILFFGNGQSNYGHEMLYYRWNLSPVNTDELQRAILSAGLVNWSGADDNYKPIDLSLEHLNNNCKTEINAYKNSTRDVDLIFDRVCLCTGWAMNEHRTVRSVRSDPVEQTNTRLIT